MQDEYPKPQPRCSVAIYIREYRTIGVPATLPDLGLAADIDVGSSVETLSRTITELKRMITRSYAEVAELHHPEEEVNTITPVMNLHEMQDAIHKVSCEKGWFERNGVVKDPDLPLLLIGPEITHFVAELMLVVTELAEVTESVRDGKFQIWYDEKGKPEGVPAEMADVFMRLLTVAKAYNIDLMGGIQAKHEYAKTRPYRHGNKLL